MPYSCIIMSIIDIDISIFEYINQGMSNPFFDALLPLWRNSLVWIPLYIFIIGFAFMNYGKKGYWLIVFLIITASTSDMTSSTLIKKSVKRLRPCNTEHLAVKERVHCGSGYSFTSSHATNHFAVATFLALTIGTYFRKIRPWLWFWAATICFAQVYVGVHFPLDVIAGGLLGGMIGLFWATTFNRFYGHILITKSLTA